MDLTRDYIEKVVSLGRAYDSESDFAKRQQLGQELDKTAFALSDGQLKQVLRIVASKLSDAMLN